MGEKLTDISKIFYLEIIDATFSIDGVLGAFAFTMSIPLILIMIFSFIGILNTLYLSYHIITRKDVKCLFFPQRWCRKVQYSEHSRTFGIPNSFAGFGMYLLIFVFSIFYLYGAMPLWPIFALIIIGFSFSLYFIYIQAFVLEAFCTYCVISAIDFLVMFISLLFLILS